MKISERLIKRLNEELEMDIDSKSKAVCLHSGKYQKATGAFSWTIADNGRDIGSQYTMREIVEAEKIEVRQCYRSGAFEIEVAE